MSTSLLDNFKVIPISKLVKADWNYKTDDPVKKEKLKENIKRNGQIENVLVRLLDTGFYEIVNGNHRQDVFVELGFEEVVAFDFGKISLAAAQRIAIETNETKFDSDTDKLAKLLQEIKLEFNEEDLKATMPFDEDEFSEMMSREITEIDFDLDNDKDYSEIEEDNFDEELPEKPKTKTGDLYELGIHRLLCGDSTDINDVNSLMDGQTAHLLYTDPPYNIAYTEFNKLRGSSREEPKGKDWGEEYNSSWTDYMPDDQFQKFLIDFLALAKKHLIPYGHYYVWHATNYYRETLKAFEANEIPYDKVPIIWKKNVAPLSWVHYKRIHEPCIFGGLGAVNGAGKAARWFGPNNETTVWCIDRDPNNSYIHPTQKPVALAARALKNSSQPGEIVLDMFAGSGTTLICSDKMSRICFTMEKEPKFCDMIVKRYIKHCKESDQSCVVKRNGIEIEESFFEETE